MRALSGPGVGHPAGNPLEMREAEEVEIFLPRQNPVGFPKAEAALTRNARHLRDLAGWAENPDRLNTHGIRVLGARFLAGFWRFRPFFTQL